MVLGWAGNEINDFDDEISSLLSPGALCSERPFVFGFPSWSVISQYYTFLNTF